MPESLEKRFDKTIRGGHKEVIRRCWERGYREIIADLGVKDDRAFRVFLEKNGAKDCPILPPYEPKAESPPIKIDDNFMDTETKNLIGELEIKILRLQGELKVKENLIELYRKQHDLKVDSDLLRVCELKI